MLITRAGVQATNTCSPNLQNQYVIRQHDLNNTGDGALMFAERYNALSHIKLTQQLEATDSLSGLETNQSIAIRAPGHNRI
jgi:hypothetical protein